MKLCHSRKHCRLKFHRRLCHHTEKDQIRQSINQSINQSRQTDNLQKKRLTEIGLFVRGGPVVELNPLSDDDGTTEELPNQLLLLLQETLCCNLDLHVVKQCGCCWCALDDRHWSSSVAIATTCSKLSQFLLQSKKSVSSSSLLLLNPPLQLQFSSSATATFSSATPPPTFSSTNVSEEYLFSEEIWQTLNFQNAIPTTHKTLCNQNFC